MSNLTHAQAATNEGFLGGALIEHLKAYINLFVSEQVDLVDVDLDKLQQKIVALDKLLDGDPSKEGYQVFETLRQTVAGLVTENADQQAKLDALTTTMNGMRDDLTARINQVETEAQQARDLTNKKVAELEEQHNAHVQVTLEKDNAQDKKLAEQAGKIEGLETEQGNIKQALAAEANRAQQAEKANADATTANTQRIDTINTQLPKLASHENVDACFVAFTAGAIAKLWQGRTQPEGLPVAAAA